MAKPTDPKSSDQPSSPVDRAAAAERERDEAIHELETIRSMRIVRLGLALSETVSARDLRGLPTRVSTALRRTDVTREATGRGEAAGTAASIGLHRSGAAPYAHVRLLHRGASNPFAATANEVEDGDHVDLVVRSPGGGEVTDSIDDGDETDSSAPVPIVAYVPNEAAIDLGIGASLVVTEDRDVVMVAQQRFGADRVLLIDPSVDIQQSNPVGFQRTPAAGICAFVERSSEDPDAVADLVAAHPGLDVVVEPGTIVPDGIPVLEMTRQAWPDHAQHYAIVAAVSGLHQTDVSFVEHVLAVSASGTPVVTEPNDRLRRLLPDMTIDPSDERTLSAVALDPLERERLSVAARRHVVREHSRRRRFEAVLYALGIPLMAPPLVSVLLSTRRPDRLADAFANIDLQRYPNVEVVAVLHGKGFVRSEVERLGAQLSARVTIIEAPAVWRLGDCLNAALESATGELVTKMDDDDAYGPEHLEDLVTAYEFSLADIVGRAPDFVYLAERDETLMITTGLAERYGHHVAGPTMLMSRDLARTLRFERRPSAVDQSLYDRAAAAGCLLYATNPFDFVLYRGHGDHTWDAKDSDFVNASILRWPGTVDHITNVDSK